MANSGDEDSEIVILQMLDTYADRVLRTFAQEKECRGIF